jgi:flagellar hook-associated protein 2
MGVASSLGLISGINYEELVSKLIQLDKKPITLLQNRKLDIQTKMGALDSLRVKLASLKSAAAALNHESMFNTRSVEVTSGGSDAHVTATATNTAAVGSYTVYVDQLARAHKIASQGWADENSTAILDSGLYPSGGTFSFRTGDSGAFTNIQITTSTTLQELKNLINSAGAGVTATILNDGTDTNPFRLVLTSDTTGASNDVQITTHATQLNFTTKLIEDATTDTTNSGTYTGTVTSNSSEYYTGTANKTYIIETITAGSVGVAGDARYQYSTDGGITWNDNGGSGFIFYTAGLTTIGSTDGTNGTGNTENVKVQFTDSGTMSAGDTFRVDVFNPTLTQAQDAVIRVDTLTLRKDRNTIDDVIDGVTLQLIKANTSVANTVTVAQEDMSLTQSDIESFVSAYNTVMKDLYTAFSYDPDNPTKSPLRGDYTVRGIQASLKNTVLNTIPHLTGSYTSLYQIGISVDNSGFLSINEYELSRALNADPLAVMKIFTDYGTPTDSSIQYMSKTGDTAAGKYSVYIHTPPAQATYESSQVVGGGGIVEDETLTFTYTEEATEVVPTVTAFTVNLSSGDTINTIVSKLNSKFRTEEVGLTATNTGGRLKITSADFGSDVKFTVISDKAPADQTGIGTAMVIKTGTDVVGTINGHTAYGKGKHLTGANGFEEEGLKISTITTTAGGKGYIYLSSGVAARLSTQLDALVNDDKGTIAYRNNTYQDIIDDIDDQIEIKETRLDNLEVSLRKQFANLEVVLSSLQAQMDYLSTQLNSLPSLYMASK